MKQGLLPARSRRCHLPGYSGPWNAPRGDAESTSPIARSSRITHRHLRQRPRLPVDFRVNEALVEFGVVT